jgi:hypothetical protein
LISGKVGDNVSSDIGLIFGVGDEVTSTGDEVGDDVIAACGVPVGAGETVGCPDGIADGEPVGGSVFKIHKFFNAFDSCFKLVTCSGKTP